MSVHTNRKILVYRLGSLGDTIMALPCFHFIKDKFANSEVTLLTNKPISSKAAPLEAILGKNSFFFNNSINYPLGTRNPFLLLKIILIIRYRQIDTLINLSAARTKKTTLRDKIFFRMAGIKHFYGFPTEDRDFEVVVDPQNGFFEWEASRLARRLSSLGNINLASSNNWDLMLSTNELTEASNILQKLPSQPILVISAGTKMQSKDWGEDNWIELISSLSSKLKSYTLIAIGAFEERDISDKCLNGWEGDKINLCGHISPRVSAAILSKAKIFVGHDSGPMHLAGSVGTPIVAIFSGINKPKQWYPRGDNNRIIYHETDCAGCKLVTCVAEKKKCILSITVPEVEKAVFSILNDVTYLQ